MSSGAIFMLIVAAAFPGIILVAMAVKWWEVRQAKRWPGVMGKVISCSIKAQENQPGEIAYNFSDTEVTNAPLVEYEYQVGGRQYRGKRITIGERTSAHELLDILARYPVGTEVTVYYDPADPEKAVLERDVPGWVWLVGGGCFLASILVPLLIAVFYFNGVEWLRPHLANPDRAPFVAAAFGFGLLVLLFALAFTRYVRQAARWPTVPGRVVATGVDAYRDWRDPAYAYRRLHYKSSVIYVYEVDGRKFAGDRLRLGVVTSSTSPGMAARLAAQYPVGKEVTVHYDPTSPGESVLHANSGWHYLIWLVGIGMIVLAWAVGSGRLG